MIVQKGYKEDRLAYRAYLGDKIIWDCGKYTSGVAEAAMLGFAMAQTETPLDIQMCAKADAILSALARAIPIFDGELKATGTMEGTASPESVTPADVELHASAVMQGFAYGYTFGLVFTSGVASGKMQGIAYAHPADVTPTSGNVAAKMAGTASADTVDVLNLLLPSSGAGIGTASAKPQAPLPIQMAATGAMTGSCGAINLPLHTVTFKVNGEIKHQERIIHGYACSDPVAAGIIDEPTKAMTVSQTFEYSGWEAESTGGEVQPGDGSTAEKLTQVLAEESRSFAYEEDIGFYRCSYEDYDYSVTLTAGATYRVSWNGSIFTMTAFETVFNGVPIIAVGNEAYFTGQSAAPTEQFGFIYDKSVGVTTIAALDTESSHTFGLWFVEEETGGDSATSDPLSCVTQDIVVHPKFTEHIRYYRISFYNGDTLHEYVNCEYGEIPVCTTEPEQEGYVFDKWTPEITAVTEDTSYYAVFAELVLLNNFTWEELSNMSAEEADRFQIGDKKYLYNTSVYATLVGKFHDDLADGSGKAKLSFIANMGNSNRAAWGLGATGWSGSSYRNWCMNTAPTVTWFKDVAPYVKAVKKKYVSDVSAGTVSTVNDTFWGPSMTELGYSGAGIAVEGERYEALAEKASTSTAMEQGIIPYDAYYNTFTRSVYTTDQNYVWKFLKNAPGRTTRDYNGRSIYSVGFCI